MELKRISNTLIQDHMAILDRYGVCISATQEWQQLFKLTEDPQGKSLNEILFGNVADSFLSEFNFAIHSNSTHQFSFSIPYKNRTISGTCFMKPWYLEQSILGGLIVYLDLEEANAVKITPIPESSNDKETELDEISYHLLVENMRNMVCLHNPDGTYFYVSPSFEELLGYQPNEMKGKNPYDFFHPDDITNIRENAHTPSLKGENEIEIEYRFRHKKGHYVWIHTLTRPLVEDGKVYALQTDSYAIEERKKLEFKLRQSEEQFRGAFEHSAIGMAIVSPEGNIMKVNQKLEEILGYGVEDIKNLNFRDITYPEDIQMNLDLQKELIQGTRKNYQMEKRYFHKNGQIVWALLAVSLVRDQSGNPKQFISQVMDITERKRSEKELKDLLELTNDQNERLVNFAHIVSHNLRAHSSNIKMLLELIDEESDPDEQASILTMLNKASDNLEDTISNLKDIVKYPSNDSLDLQEISLKNSIEKTLANLEAFILKNYAIVINEVESSCKVLANPAYLDSILLNLITNAIKYARPRHNPKIRFSVKKSSNNKVKLLVQDNGKGIDLGKYGDEIFKLHHTFHGNPDAKGIGLFMTRNQVESMGGSIEIESEPDNGTVFIVKLLSSSKQI